MENSACVRMWNYLRGSFRYISLLFLQTWFFVNYVYNWYKFRYELCATLLLLYTNILTLGYSMYCRYYYHKWACDYFLCGRWCFYFVNVRLFTLNLNNSQSCVRLAVFRILTHAQISVFKGSRIHIYNPFSKTRQSFELKNTQKQLAGIP